MIKHLAFISKKQNKKKLVFIPTPTFGSKTKPIYCNFYPFSISANNVLCSITLVANSNVFPKSTSGFGEAGWGISFFCCCL
jgi:hypothetical protein